ncbi:MAG: glutamate 5-kinase [Chlorobium sp.]|uniref:glutamate 5-kinase n=1 Tax=Chlorobium sp. TaxID=1095 RepID=UPI001D7CE137|nr:glutamate 5-kinase [Chlorobium sp.]MBN1279622.1 glutamate 5-kinase [Chlorobiaceae bacterium]MCF8215620.1 glutamate 5-kinase [Chlorobium sp.]MCF8270675.1 glutamate 5-kinase [Chlorobium sp.]MCF8286829.1 glutamate 5-kinase [Chlorobium sp.]MCF8290595.1 glutamate 5-kinase [Chlorobium sp.]
MMNRNPIYQKIVIKVGTNVITGKDGRLDTGVLAQLTCQIAELHKQGVQVILVSSGAVGAGRSIVTLAGNLPPVATRQVLSATGQIRLINTYTDMFADHGLITAQILVTKEDFRDRVHYLNMRTCFASLLHQHIIPVVNENDAVSVTELMFTDNDELSGLIASMMHVDGYIILSHVDGLFDMKTGNSAIIREISPSEKHFHQYIAPGKSEFGRGGMLTKCHIAQKLSRLGITVHIANGKTPDILLSILDGKCPGTTFLPEKPTYGPKRWIAHTEGMEKGSVTINDGARSALTSGERANSLLPVGIESVQGTFFKGDIVKICATDGTVLGYGMAGYNSEKTRSILGQKGQKPFIHYDYLYIIQ